MAFVEINRYTIALALSRTHCNAFIPESFEQRVAESHSESHYSYKSYESNESMFRWQIQAEHPETAFLDQRATPLVKSI